MSIQVFRKFLPSFGLGLPSQEPVAVYVVLSINDAVGDCAAYEGVGPVGKVDSDWENDPTVASVRDRGQKIWEKRARELFPVIDQKKLRYRA